MVAHQILQLLWPAFHAWNALLQRNISIDLSIVHAVIRNGVGWKADENKPLYADEDSSAFDRLVRVCSAQQATSVCFPGVAGKLLCTS